MAEILFLSSNPVSSQKLGIEEEIKKIDASIRGTDYGSKIHLNHWHAISRLEIQEYLLRFEPALVHFSGHGDSDGSLTFQGPDGQPEVLEAETLAEIFNVINNDEKRKEKDKVRCLLLSACYSLERAEAVAQYVDCVIGTTKKISDESATMFEEAFYRGLGEGMSFQRAFTLGRLQLKLGERNPTVVDLVSRKGVDPAKIYLVEDQTETLQDRASTSHLKPAMYRNEKKIFFGRAKELEKINEYIRASNAPITITGEGGIGKSSLAFKGLHACESLVDAIVPLYLESEFTFSSLLLEIAKGLELEISDFEKADIETRRQTVIDALGKFGRVVIYADGYELVVGAIEKDPDSPPQDELRIHSLLGNVPPNTIVLVTSRQRENLDGERVIRLDGLSVDEGRDFFVEVSGSDVPDPVPSEIRKAIEEIVRKTGGHPLSIELLARRYRGEGLSELTRMLDNLGIGIVNPKEEVARRRSLASCFDFTFNNFDENQKSIIPMLTLFKSPFPASAVEHIFGAETRKILGNLSDYGLLRQIDPEYGPGDSTYRLFVFHPVVKNYLEHKLTDKGKLEQSYGDRFSQYYAALIEETYASLKKKDRIQSLSRFDLMAEGENNDPERAVSLTSDGGLAGDLSANLGVLFAELRFLKKAEHYLSKALEFHDELQDQARIARDCANLGIIVNKMGGYERALQFLNRALKIHEKLEDKNGMAGDFRNLGNLSRSRKRYEESLSYHKKGLKIHEELRAELKIAGDYTNIGTALNDLGNYKQSLGYHEKALAIREKHRDEVGPAEIADDYTNIAIVLRNVGNYKRSLDYHKKALEVHNSLGDRFAVASDYTNIGLCQLKIGKEKQAAISFNNAKGVLKEIEQRTGQHHPNMQQIREIAKLIDQFNQ